jgi:Rieske Fe-S protein
MSSCPYHQGTGPVGEAGENARAQTSRRGFFHACFAIMTAIAGFLVAFPIFSFLRLPRRIKTSQTIELPLASRSENQAQFFEREGTQIVVIYTNREPKVFDAACTHLGCLVAWDQNDHVFRCPCHGAVFSDLGAPLKGPVNMPLKTIKLEIAKGTLVIA